MELTEAGKLLYNRIQPVLSELNSIYQELQNFYTPKNIEIGTLPSLATNYLPLRIVDLRQKGISVNLRVFSTSKEVLDSFNSRLIDAAIVADISIEKIFWTTELLTEPFYVILPAAHRLSRFSSITLNDIKVEPLVVCPLDCDIRQTITRVYQRRGIQLKIAAEVNHGESILRFVIAGAGVTILPQLFADHVTHLPLSTVPIADFEEMRTISLVTRSEQTGQMLHRYFWPLINQGAEELISRYKRVALS